MLQAQLTIARNELQQLKSVVDGRKAQRGGKSLVIKDKFVLTTLEILDQMLAAEAEKTAKKKYFRGRKESGYD